MDSCSVLLALCVASTKRSIHAAQMRALRRRLHERDLQGRVAAHGACAPLRYAALPKRPVKG
ncbi:hypothetical protein PR002_g21675 [Phytophthora rubi]|uniref:Uncharacterized protein n=1 Tax=Phytophthora rubi TaxID=129364 RepID=A0A6A3J2I6_9STRA|nr:hypothetical protein PR002_g21675 [Phytophthora rubi]